MEAKLIKFPDGDWVVEVPEDSKGIKASVMQGHFGSTFGHGHKLSLKNCQAIERGYDLEDLATDAADSYDSSGNWHTAYELFKAGFQKALELMGDKKFSEENMINFGCFCFNNTDAFNDAKDLFEKYQSLQQTEWDVDIEMEYHPTFQIIKLDADGCLILKRI